MTYPFPQWTVDPGLTAYLEAVAAMEARVAAIRAKEAPEWVWLLEHPPLYTAGTSAKASDLLDPDRFPVYPAGRGGQYTYHGPGQRVAYVMLDLKARGGDIRRYVHDLEEWLIRSLGHFAIRAERRAGRVGLWVETGQGQEAKIAALGVRVRQGVTYHGVAVNLEPDLSHFAGIVPCGIQGHGVTSLLALGHTASLEDLDLALKSEWGSVFA
ncbi:MAG: lipoyl(octanoyl) transferase LipB [Alphaproteobacteria bacterium]|jgi:lipoyl(octanoyl) transferase|nr:lipoyl(octanoyl) transferase LipB [Alphaproteobacteria bacterium]